jgi:hypothetical protein
VITSDKHQVYPQKIEEGNLQVINHPVGQASCLSVTGISPALEKILKEFFLWKSLIKNRSKNSLIMILSVRLLTPIRVTSKDKTVI